jgi:Glyoxalase superfamily protein
MRSYLDAKLMAKTLRDALAQKNISLSHSETLEIVAQQFGFADWNILAAKLNSTRPPEPESTLPAGWTKWGKAAECYDMGIEPELKHKGQKVAFIRRNQNSIPPEQADGAFGTLMQTFSAQQWHDKKLELTAELKSEAADGVQMWMRVDGPMGLLRFDNMDYRRLKGTQDWAPARIVLAVPDNAITVNFGFFVIGQGTGWASNFNLKVVDHQEPETMGMTEQGMLDQPTNLSFAN